MKTPLRVLLAEDDEGDARLLLRELRKGGYDVTCQRVDTPDAFRAALGEGGCDIVLSDYNFPRFSGSEALKIFRESGLDLPFVFVSGAIGEDAAVEAMKSGAHDYVMKSHLARLCPTVERELREAEERRRGRAAEEAMRTSEYKYRHLFEAMSDAAFLVELQSGKIIDCNAQAEALLGQSRSEILGRNQMELYPPDESHPMEGDTEETQGGRESRVVRADGSLVPVHACGSRIELYGRQCMLMLFRDIASRKQLEEKFLQAQKMEAIGLLAGGIAHDFNNLLSIIQLQSSLLVARADLDDATRKGIAEILGAAKRAGSLTRKLLAVGRRQAQEARDIDLGAIVEGMVAMLRRALGETIALASHVAPDLPAVHADPGMMEQVLMNLAINARDAMPDGGRLSVRLDAVEIDQDYVSTHPDAAPGRFLRLTVADSGCGIPPEHLLRIFEPFFTTKEVERGTGLGLATIFGIVRQHGGWIEVASAVGEGTTFQVFLPALKAPARKIPPAEKDESIRGHGETILLVEDEAPLRILARTALERYGYQVLEATTAAEALQQWDSYSDRVDLLLTDCVMPGGVSGQELVERLRKSEPELKMICTSGYSNDLFGERLRVSGCEFLRKPYSARTLARIVRQCLDKPRDGAPLNEPSISSTT
jgi:PAS domain S-box-containing protein